MKYLFILICLAGCASVRVNALGPSTFEISCKSTEDKCFAEAGRWCPHGFHVLSRQNHAHTPMFADPLYSHSMAIKCVSSLDLPLIAPPEEVEPKE